MAALLTLEAYLEWHAATLGEDLRLPDLGPKFDANTIVAHNVTTSHPFMTELAARLGQLAREGVFQDTARAPNITLFRKPFQSAIEKIYRINHVWNRRWTDAPKTGWVTYQNCFEKLDDVIRTTLVTSYLDGPEAVSNAILQSAQASGLTARASPRATDNGYYAWHSYVELPTQIILNDAVVEIPLKVEFQTTTLLQSALRELTHRLYEEQRIHSPVGRTDRRWDYASRHFRGEFLGHTLHLVDAMILELRDGANSAGSVEPVAESQQEPPALAHEVHGALAIPAQAGVPDHSTGEAAAGQPEAEEGESEPNG